MRRLLFLLMVASWPTMARAEWREARTPHFLIYSQGNEKSLRQRAERLEALHYLMLRANGIEDDPHPYRVRVFVLASTTDVQRMMDTPKGIVAGFYRPLTEGPVAFIPEGSDSGLNPQIVLFHEYAHHFMLQNFPVAYPAWYIEGFAELVSTSSFEHPGKITYGKVADHRSYEFEGQVVDARDMLLKPSLPLSYGNSWLLTHYLTFAPDRRGQLRAFLAAFNTGASTADAAKAFGDLGKLNRDVSLYLSAANFGYVPVAIPPGIGKSITVRVLPLDEDAILPLVMEFTKRMDKERAAVFLEKVQTATSAFPDSAAALKLRAEVEIEQGAIAAALATTERLVALAPGDARAQYFRGAALIAQAKADSQAGGGTYEAQLAVARRAIIAANKIDPDDPLPLLAFYEIASLMPGPLTQNAIDALGRAQEIVAQDHGTRLTFANVLIARGDAARAARLLRPLAYDPHGGKSAAVALQMLATIDSANAAQAQAGDVAKSN